MSAQTQDAPSTPVTHVYNILDAGNSLLPQPTHPRAELFDFINREGRLPRIGDQRAPWTYCGWMLPYVIALHAHPFFGKSLDDKSRALSLVAHTTADLSKRGIGHCPDRWGYHLRTLAAGELLDEPIPRIEFRGEFDTVVRRVWEGEREGIAGWCHIVEQTEGYTWESFKHLIDWIAFSLGVETQPAGIGEAANEALYRRVNIEPLLLQPCDYFGAALSARKSGGGKAWNPTAFFPTPHHVVEMMTQMTFAHGEDLRSKKVCDPTVGTGRMLLHASNYSLRLYGMDIDPLVLKICKINGALYAPWISFPLPTSLFDEDAAPSETNITQPSHQPAVLIRTPTTSTQASLF